MMFIIVDLPEPEVPMMASDEPCSIVRSTPRSAWTRLSPITYVRVMPRISTSGGIRTLPRGAPVPRRR
jgi:hypothetical protein